MSIDNATNEALKALVVLDEETAQRAINADRAYSEAQDEWIEDWIAANADDPEDEDECDELRDGAQDTQEYEAFCDEVLVDIAAEYDITLDVLGHAIALMNNECGEALLEQRRAERTAKAAGTVLH